MASQTSKFNFQAIIRSKVVRRFYAMVGTGYKIKCCAACEASNKRQNLLIKWNIMRALVFHLKTQKLWLVLSCGCISPLPLACERTYLTVIGCLTVQVYNYKFLIVGQLKLDGLSSLARNQVIRRPINSGKRTEWSLIRSVIKRVITKSDDRKVGVWFVKHECDYRPTSDDTKFAYQLIIKITIFEKHKK